jgi:CHAT domain-containing protein
MYRVPLAGELDALVDRFQALIATHSEGTEIRTVSARLYDLLIRPFAGQVEQDSRLVLVPDKRLQFVPFAALFDERRGHFLVEAYEISVAPSLEIFRQSESRYDALRTTAAPAVLSVGNPAFDQKAYLLPTLPGARREAVRVAALYPRSHLLVDAAATRRAFLDAALTANIIHFAGHGIVRPEVPLLSQLVLAPDTGRGLTGALYGKDVFEMNLPATRLTILSGCHTAGGELSESEGVSSLARAFFAAGVPAVIASLWAIEDAATGDFFAVFHNELSRGQNPARALQQSQLAALTQNGGPWRGIAVWGAFQLFGAAGGGR